MKQLFKCDFESKHEFSSEIKATLSRIASKGKQQKSQL